MIITFLPGSSVIKIDSPITLKEAASFAGLSMGGFCNGMGTCGKCRVKILAGSGTPLTQTERQQLTEEEIGDGIRLACRFIPKTDVTAELLQEEHVIRTAQEYAGTPLEDTEAVSFDEDGETFSGSGQFGIAFDMGTTVVAARLLDRERRNRPCVMSRMNPQRVHGADVAARVSYIGRDPERLAQLRGEMIGCMNEMIAELCGRAGIDPHDITECSVCGNMTMSHIFAGVDPYPLGVAPFEPVFCERKTYDTKEVPLGIHPEGRIHLMPGIGGQVGSDITADLLLASLPGSDPEAAMLLVDIGTNGEVVIRNRTGGYYAGSAAAGPAFEGGTISCGMPASDGAIAGVDLSEGELKLDVIGGGEPKGICGSGLVDAAAWMLDLGVMGRDGRIRSRDEVPGLAEAIRERIVPNGETNDFILWEGEKQVVITQKDIRQLQLAKGAVAAVTETVMEAAKITAEDLDQVIVTGAFGSHIDFRNAVKIGLLPDAKAGSYRILTNGAVEGAALMITSDVFWDRAERIPQNATHVGTAGSEMFQERFLRMLEF